MAQGVPISDLRSRRRGQWVTLYPARYSPRYGAATICACECRYLDWKPLIKCGSFDRRPAMHLLCHASGIGGEQKVQSTHHSWRISRFGNLIFTVTIPNNISPLPPRSPTRHLNHVCSLASVNGLVVSIENVKCGTRIFSTIYFCISVFLCAYFHLYFGKVYMCIWICVFDECILICVFGFGYLD